jgi:hypothetical protein
MADRLRDLLSLYEVCVISGGTASAGSDGMGLRKMRHPGWERTIVAFGTGE